MLSACAIKVIAKSETAQRVDARYRAIQEIRDNLQFSHEAKATAFRQIENGVPLQEVLEELKKSLDLRMLQEI